MQKPFLFAAAVAVMIVLLPTTAVLAQDTNTAADKAAPAAAAPPAATPPAATAPAATTPSATTPSAEAPATTSPAATVPATAAEQTAAPTKKKARKMTRQQEIDRSIDRGTVPARYRRSVPKEYQQYIPFDKR